MTERQWDNPRYQRMQSVDYQDGWITVSFEDNSSARVDAARVLAPTAEPPDWSTLEFDTYEIRVLTPAGLLEVPWSTIRALTDAGYSAHLDEAGAEQRRQIGLRIRALRKECGLTAEQLAWSSDVATQTLFGIERGQCEVQFNTLQRILSAMGYSLADLAPVHQERPVANS